MHTDVYEVSAMYDIFDKMNISLCSILLCPFYHVLNQTLGV